MRRNVLIVSVSIFALAAGTGCWRNAKKFDTSVPHSEEFNAPPSEARYDNPPESGYKKPPPKKEFRPGPGGAGGGMGGPGGPGQQ